MKVFGVIGGCAGKAGIMRQLVAELTGRGLRVSTIKRVPDTVDLERPDSGTWHHRAAGAEEVMLASTSRIALLREMRTTDDEPDVDALLMRLATVDLVLLEGFRLTCYPKLEVVQPGGDRRLFAHDDPRVCAVTADVPITGPVPFLLSTDIKALADLILARAVAPGEQTDLFWGTDARSAVDAG